MANDRSAAGLKRTRAKRHRPSVPTEHLDPGFLGRWLSVRIGHAPPETTVGDDDRIENLPHGSTRSQFVDLTRRVGHRRLVKLAMWMLARWHQSALGANNVASIPSCLAQLAVSQYVRCSTINP
jgi:hypothetical protein